MTLHDTILAIRKYLLDRHDDTGILFTFHGYDDYDWKPMAKDEAENTLTDTFIPFPAEAKNQLRNTDDPDYLIISHILDCIMTLYHEDKQELASLLSDLQGWRRKGAESTNANYSREERQRAAKKAWKKRRK